MALPDGSYPPLVAKLNELGITTLNAAHAALHVSNLTNPVAPAKLPVRLNLTVLASYVPAALRVTLVRHANLVNAVRDNDKPAALAALQAMRTANEITAAQLTNIINLVQSTVDDPDWPLQINWCESVYGRSMSDDELREGLRRAQA